MSTGSRVRALGVALGVALVLLLATRQLGCNLYSSNGTYRAQVDAFLSGRLALSESPAALLHDFAWTESGVQHVWGLGVPMWQTPFELIARAIGQGPFPDRIAMLIWIALAIFVLLRAFRRDDEPWWIRGGSVLIVALLPGLIAMMRGYMTVYEEAATYAYMAAAMLLGGVVALLRKPTRNRYLLLLLAAGLTGLIRPTVWFYGVSTAVLATAIYVRHVGRRGVAIIALGAALFVAGGAVLYATNAARFGKGTEFGHRLNIESLPGNVYATRFSYPFERVGTIEAATELVGGLFGSPERTELIKRSFYEKHVHVGQSETPRWREYYFTTFSWPYLPLILAGLVLGVLAWRKRQEEQWIAAWAVIGALPLVVFYLRAPSISSRYQLDLAPAIAALLVIAWRAGARWMIERKRGVIAPIVLVVLWLLAVVTGVSRPGPQRSRIDREDARGLKLPAFPVDPKALPATYDLADPKLEQYLDADGKPPELYLNGTGWQRRSGRVQPAATFYVNDPQFVELTVSPPDAQVQAALDLDHLELISTTPAMGGATLRFAVPEGKHGLHVLFLAFGPDTELDRVTTDIILRRVRTR